MSAGDAARPARGPDAPEPPPVPPSRVGAVRAALRRYGWPALCLFQFGLMAGGYFFGLHHAGPAEEARPEPAAAERAGPVVPPKEQPPPPAVGDIGRADDLLREGRYEAALAIYQPLSAGAAAPLRDGLVYRVALCQEGLGRWDQALASFRAVASRTANRQAAAAAQLGQARVWVRMRRPAEARAALYDLLLRPSGSSPRDQAVRADARFLLALALTQEAWHAGRPGPLSDAVAAHRANDWSVERVLDWAAPPRGPEPPPVGAEGTVAVRPPRHAAGQPTVRAAVRNMPVADLIDRLARGAGLRPQWTAAARQQAADRSRSVTVENVPLPDVLRALAGPLGLVWQVQGGALSVSAEAEMGKEELAAYRVAAARRALLDALVAHPEHGMAAAACLELGNRWAAEGRPNEAAVWYQRLISDFPRSPVSVEGAYNLALVQRRLGDLAAARQSFFRVVDRNPAHELAPLAYLKIGQMALYQCEPERALSPLRKALSGGTGSGAQPAAVVNLAAAYLLVGNPGAARAALLDHRECLGREPYRAAAAFLDSLARFRLTAEQKQREREAGVLLGTLLAAQEDAVLGAPGRLLAGQAYRELAMPEQTARLYEKMIPTVQGPLRDEMLCTLAEVWQAGGRRDAAAKLYAALADAPSGRWGPHAQFRLAEMALEERSTNDCLRWCQKLLREGRYPDAAAVLKLMGRACEQAGDYQQAARCFRGEVPAALPAP